MSNYNLLEALADIAYIAGNLKYYGGDSRGDIATFIELAKEFEKIHKKTEWGVDEDYIDAITAFAERKLHEILGTPFTLELKESTITKWAIVYDYKPA
jgi:hypothetical protein